MVKPVIFRGMKTDYTIDINGQVFRKNGKPMKNRFTTNDYMQACLRINKKYYYAYVHRLVYESFIGNIPSDKEINHIDGNKINNALNNLELVSGDENILHSWKNSLAYIHDHHAEKYSSIETQVNSKVPLDVREKICKDLEEATLTYAKIVDKYKVPPSILYMICKGYIWKDISSKYDIAGRYKRRSEYYKERDEKIKFLRLRGWKIQEIADSLDISFDAVARRISLMRRRCIL